MSEWTGYAGRRMEEMQRYERISNAPKRIRGEAFGGVEIVNHSRQIELATCQSCGSLVRETLTEFEDQRVCQSCLEGLAESTAMYAEGQWELLSCYGVCATYATEAEAQEAVAYAASRGVARTYRRRES